MNNENEIVVYEVIRIFNKKILFFNDHLIRFRNSLQLINVELDENEILFQIRRLIDESLIETGNIKFQITHHKVSKENHFSAFFIPHAYPTEQMYLNGVEVISYEAFRPTPSAKIIHNDLKTQMDALLQKYPVFEIIMIHPDGYVTEGSRSNVFMIKNDIVYSAPINDILCGITYQNIVRICKKHSILFEEKRISKNEVLTMDALFLTGTSPKILPIRQFDETNFNVNHPIIRKLIQQYDELILDNLT